jgi:hypothetical protein
MDAIQIQCPQADCNKLLRIKVLPEQPTRKCRCPVCKTVFAMTVHPPTSPAEEEDSPGVYGFAEESSLAYLVRREQDGFKLTPDEKKTKKRLLREKLAENPTCCPLCQMDIEKDAVICITCGLNLKTGKKLTTIVERLGPRKAYGAIVSEETAEVAAELAVQVTIEIISSFLG